MYFKETKIEEEFFALDPKLRMILCEVECYMYPQPMIITCLMRTPEEQEELFRKGEASSKISVHCYGRGADLRLFDQDSVELIDYINTTFPYDKSHTGLKTAMIHGGTATHIHLQCRPLAEAKIKPGEPHV